MSQRELRRIVLSDYKAKKEDEGAIWVDVGDGADVKVPPPVLWSEDARRLAERAQRGDETVDMAAMFEQVLGADQWARFVDAGGTAMLLAEMIGERLGATVGESAASSGS